ncbi:NADH-quinone oxidoreductase subunit M [Lyngbya confervoides]|uniref:NADH-quinone oxidoreductase subunit M n=1 Tax=Lyngbya confervoides BDU141951 TaxID=1574623 RepID=A0ABD4T641_9CYAN|nr:NADH-quinone oxidoreductase subunit M [Lyngbya confervoides]MCM1983914.1 NADH-quinone oxidoreductase subunit M [Lyngbya confervoides BDU141951]
MLSTFLLIPLLGAIILALWPQESQVQSLAKGIASLVVLWTVYALSLFQTGQAQLQMGEFLPWLPNLGLNYALAVDGLSMPLLALSSSLTWIAIFSSPAQLDRPRLYYSLIFLVNIGVSGSLLAQNLLLFFLFYELELIPFYLLVSIWGGERKGYAATKFLLYTALSGILILMGFLGLTWLGEGSSFDYSSLDTTTIPQGLQLILLTILLLGFGIKTPLVPLHTWQPDVYVEASPPVAILLGGVLAKLGTYGLIRFGLELFPDTWNLVAPGLAIIGTVSVIYGAMSAIAQSDVKRMVAYSSIGHMGYILVAAAAGNTLSLTGAITQMVSHGLILALLFHLLGIVEAKVGTRDLNRLNGLMNPIRGLPLTSALLVLAGMASAGIPGLVGFIAEYLVFQGSFARFPIPTLLCIISSGLTAVYFVILINRTCFGRLDSHAAYYPKVTFAEQAPSLLLMASILFLGLQPLWLTQWSESTSAAIVAQIRSAPMAAALSSTAPTLPQG